MMDTFNYLPSWGPQLSITPNVFKADFGDGYTQSVPNGLNHMMESWDLQFNDIGNDDYVAIKSFLKAHRGTDRFLWTTPDGDTLIFICEKWTASPPSFGVRNMTMTFQQVPA